MRYVYIITLERDEDDDAPELHDGTDEGARRQVARELQEAMDDTGLPVGRLDLATRILVP